MMVDLPDELTKAVQVAIETHGQKALAKEVKRLSDAYRAGKPSFFTSPLSYLAYLCTRFPATYAVAKRVLEECAPPIRSVVDCGAGFGVSLWALPDASSYHLIEKDEGLVSFANSLKNFPNATWEKRDLTQIETFPKGDLFLFSYSLTEVPQKFYPEIVKRVYSAAQKEIVIIEPGTPEGYRRILHLRSLFIEQGGFVVAPCPHEKSCPLTNPDWCHFSKRLPRTPWHRLLKEATLGYEDEKFSYLIISKETPSTRNSRILRRPQKNRGHICLKLCTSNGLEERVVTKKEKELYRKTKKQQWGDCF